MLFEPVLIAALGALTIYALRHPRLSPADAHLAPAPTPADGALRLARNRLVSGEIDIAEYRRIEAVLRA